MVNGGIKFLFHSGDFFCQQGDTRFQFADRKRIEILLCQQGQRVGRSATGKKVIRVHRMNVDPMWAPVNKQ